MVAGMQYAFILVAVIIRIIPLKPLCWIAHPSFSLQGIELSASGYSPPTLQPGGPGRS